MITNTISIPELIWTLGSFLGCFFNGRQLYRATEDYLVIKLRKINSIREYAAVTTFIMFGSWTGVQFVFFLLGALRMLQPNLNTNAQYTFALAFCSISGFLALTGYIVDVRRRHIVNLIKEFEDFDEPKTA